MGLIASGPPEEWDAFWSYSRADDAAVGGRISELAADLAEQVVALGAPKFDVFVDRDLRPGDGWPGRVDGALRSARFLVAIVTPRYFARAHCRYELETFDRLALPGSGKRILPIHYFHVAEILAGAETPDPLVRVIRDTQQADWREVGLEDATSAPHRKAVRELVAAVRREGPPWSTPRVADHLPLPADVDGDGRASFEAVLRDLDGDLALVVEVLDELERTIADDAPAPDRASSSGFVAYLGTAERLRPELEDVTSRLDGAVAALAAGLRSSDPMIPDAVRSVAAEHDLAAGEPGIEVVLDERAVTVDAAVRSLEGTSAPVVDGMAWSRPLRPASDQLDQALDRLREAQTILHAWVQLGDAAVADAREGGRGERGAEPSGGDYSTMV